MTPTVSSEQAREQLESMTRSAACLVVWSPEQRSSCLAADDWASQDISQALR